MRSGEITVEIEDRGRPFDPLARISHTTDG